MAGTSGALYAVMLLRAAEFLEKFETNSPLHWADALHNAVDAARAGAIP